MPTPLFTIILPVHREPTYLPLSVASVLRQSVEAFELFIVEDGAPEETHACVAALANADTRIRVFKFPKGPRHGEGHRAAALEQARGSIIAHINDDSLWLPDHLAIIRERGGGLDFGHTLHTEIEPDGRVASPTDYIEDPDVRWRMLRERFNVANMCDVFYTRQAYERLPEGWAPAPEGIWTDLHMWRKFLRQKLRFGTIHECTAPFFNYPKGFSDQESRAHVKSWLDRLESVEGCDELRGKVARIHSEAALRPKKLSRRLRGAVLRVFSGSRWR